MYVPYKGGSLDPSKMTPPPPAATARRNNDINITRGANVDVNTGKLYTEEEAKQLPEPKQKNLIWMTGGMDNIEKVSKAVKAQHKKARKQAKKSRRKNRG